jgi:1-acyl-sn-glycerol-3-phosphate acyltransferase
VKQLVGGAIARVAQFLAGATIHGERPSDTRQRIYFANHTSHLDFVVIWAALPPNVRACTRPVAAKDYWDKRGVRGYLAREVFNAVLIERDSSLSRAKSRDHGWRRGDVADDHRPSQMPAGAVDGASTSLGTKTHDPIETLVDGLGESHSLIVFPEGTRGSGTDPAPFKSGLYRVAMRRPDVELVPVLIDNLNRILPKGEFTPVPLLSHIAFGQPMRVGDGEAKGDFLERARKAVLELRQW